MAWPSDSLFVFQGKKSGVRKRYFQLTEDLLKQNPAICSYDAASLDQRQDLAVDLHPKLAMEAANKAIAEWGRPKSAITHLILCTIAGVDMPGADVRLLKLLGLPPSVNRLMLYNLGCYASGTLLRVAKDIAENNLGVRVLGVCVETLLLSFRAPSAEANPVYLAGNAIFGDGAGAMIIGAVPTPGVTTERPIFEIVSASQTTVPSSDWAVGGQYREIGLTMRLSRELPTLVSSNLEDCVVKAFGSQSVVIEDWNSIFWAVHPGGSKILDHVEAKFGLAKDKLRATRHVLEEYGNMSSASVVFILDEIRKNSAEEEKATTGEGLDHGVLLGFGPGITIETVVLRSLPPLS